MDVKPKMSDDQIEGMRFHEAVENMIFNIEFEATNNSCVINKIAFIEALDNNIRKFIDKHYRD